MARSPKILTYEGANGSDVLPPTLRQAIARRVKRLMAERDLGDTALAAEAGVAVNSVYAVTRATGGGLTLLAKLAAALNVPVDTLFTDQPSSRPEEATTVPVKGGANRAVWRSTAMKDEPRGAAADVVPQDPRYQRFPRYGRVIEDDSLMGFDPPVPAGSIAIYADLADSDIAIEAGIYLVHRIDGDNIKSMFVTIDAYRDRYEMDVLGARPAERETIPREEFEAGTAVAIGGRLVATHSTTVTAAGRTVVTTVRYL